MPLRILLADDEEKVCSALRFLLEQEPDLLVVGNAGESASLRAALLNYQPDLLLLDWELPGLSKRPLLALRRLRPGLKVVALSVRPDARAEANASGVDAFISKGDPPEIVLSTVRSMQPHQETQ